MNQNAWDLIKTGNKRAFTDLYNNYIDLLYSYGMKIVPDGELVRESVQNLFIHIYEQREYLSHPASIKAYLFSSLKRILIRAENRNKRMISLDQAEALNLDIQYEPNIETKLINRQYEENYACYIQSLIDSLSPREQEAIYLKYYNNLSNKEIADILKISPQATRNLIYMAVYKMRKNRRNHLYFFFSE